LENYFDKNQRNPEVSYKVQNFKVIFEIVCKLGKLSENQGYG